MKKNITKKAFDLAHKEIEEKQIKYIKGLVKKTLERIESIKKQKDKLVEEMKVLKMDIDDLKAGRLSKIEERQAKSKVAKEKSIIKIINNNIVYPANCTSAVYQDDNSTIDLGYSNVTLAGAALSNDIIMTTNCSAGAEHNGPFYFNTVSGTYKLDTGEVKFL